MTTRTVYVDGHFVPEDEARVSIFDRGFLFADAIYEVTSVIGGKLLDFADHMARLRRSLGELDMPYEVEEDQLLEIHRDLVRRNDLDEGIIYMQVSRGAADRDFIFPDRDTPPTVVLFTQKKTIVDAPSAKKGLSVISVPDLRWQRRDIKTVQLLYPSMAKMEAKARGADDAWLVEDGFVTEGTSNNAYIVTKEGRIVTRDLSHSILHGITRKAVIAYAKESGLSVEERRFSIEEALEAAEAFTTSASGFVTPVVRIDGKPVGDGAVGAIARRLREIYIEQSLKTAI